MESLKDQMQAVGMSIAKAVSDWTLIINDDTDPSHQETCMSDLNIELENLRSTESVDSAQAAAATSHKEWVDIKSVDGGVQKNLSDVFWSGRALKGKLEREKTLNAEVAFKEYREQGKFRKSDPQTDLIQICQI